MLVPPLALGGTVMTLRALLTNDDGIHAAGLDALREACREAGIETVTIAPDGNRSAAGRSVTVRAPLRLQEIHADPEHPRWSCNGSPTDCTRVGLLSGAFPPVDIVLSGINHGANLGDDVSYSGTVAAAAEAALLGLPAIAASQSGPSEGAGFLAERPKEFIHTDVIAQLAILLAEDRPPVGIFVNVNLPMHPTDQPAMSAPLGTREWRSVKMRVTELPDGLEIQSWATDPPPVLSGATDFDVVLQGGIAVTAISAFGGVRDATDHLDLTPQLTRLSEGGRRP